MHHHRVHDPVQRAVHRPVRRTVHWALHWAGDRRHRRLHQAAAFLAACGCLLGATIGCQSKPPRIDYSPQLTQEDEAFLKGVNRPAAPSTLFAMSRMLIGQGRVAEAEMVLRRILEQDPGFVPAYLELAELALRRNRVGDAAELLVAGLKLAPRDGRLLNNLGMCWLLRGEHELALDAFTRAAAARPDDARPLANVATTLGLMGRYDEALAAFSQVLPPAEAHYNLGILCEARNDAARAEQEFGIASTLDGRLPRVADTATSLNGASIGATTP